MNVILKTRYILDGPQPQNRESGHANLLSLVIELRTHSWQTSIVKILAREVEKPFSLEYVGDFFLRPCSIGSGAIIFEFLMFNCGPIAWKLSFS